MFNLKHWDQLFAGTRTLGINDLRQWFKLTINIHA